MDYAAESLKLHYQWNGKLDTVPKMPVDSKEALIERLAELARLQPAVLAALEGR